jgi:hypothetical protein
MDDLDKGVKIEEADGRAAVSTMDQSPAKARESAVKYRHNSLDGFQYGAAFDWRVRLASEMLIHSPMFDPPTIEGYAAKEVAAFALDVATELVALAESRGLVEPFEELNQDGWLQAQARRTAAYQIFQQSEGKRMTEENGRITRAIFGALGEQNQ